MTTRVVSRLARYRGAIGELPVTVAGADSPQDAVVVLDGSGAWWDEALVAMASGAHGIVVGTPAAAPARALERLAGVPIVLERALLRPDVAADVVALAAEAAAAGPTTAVVVECHARSAVLPTALRDAVAWTRLLAPAPMTLHTATFTRGRGVALLGAGDAASVSLLTGASAGAPADGRVRITTLGVTRLELEIEGADVTFAVTDAASRRLSPTRFERPERVALRRIAAAVQTGVAPADLEEYARDTALAEAILRSGSAGRPESFTS